MLENHSFLERQKTWLFSLALQLSCCGTWKSCFLGPTHVCIRWRRVDWTGGSSPAERGPCPSKNPESASQTKSTALRHVSQGHRAPFTRPQILGSEPPAPLTSDVHSGIMTLAPVPEGHARRVGILRKSSRCGVGTPCLGFNCPRRPIRHNSSECQERRAR